MSLESTVKKYRPGRGRWGMGEGGRKGQTSSYRRSPGGVTYSVVTVVNNVVYLSKLRRE